MFGTTTAVGVDIGDDAIRVVQLRRHMTGYDVVRVAACPRPTEASPDETGALLAALLREAGVSRRRVAVAFPAADTAVKTASLPPARPTELAQVARFEAETQFPLPLTDLVWGFSLTPEGDGRSHAVIAGARRSQVEARVALFAQAGVVPVAVLPTPLAAAETLEHVPDGVYLLIVAGARWTDLCLYDGERLLATRGLPAGDPRSAAWSEAVARAARPWSAGHERPRGAVLLGDVAPAARDALQAALGMEVSLDDPWAEIRDPQRRLADLRETRGAYAVAIGLAKAALQPVPAPNLLPAAVTEARGQVRRLSLLLAALACIAALLVPVAWRNEEHLRARNRELAQARTAAREARQGLRPAPGTELTAVQHVLADLRRPASNPLELLRRMSVHLPKTLTLSDFTYTRGKALVIKGRADVQSTVATALRTLHDLPGVKRANLDYATLAKGEDAKGYDFQITCVLTPVDDPTVGSGRGTKAAKRGAETP
jgi:hypothetical protein